MQRRPGQMALYEAIQKSRSRSNGPAVAPRRTTDRPRREPVRPERKAVSPPKAEKAWPSKEPRRTAGQGGSRVSWKGAVIGALILTVAVLGGIKLAQMYSSQPPAANAAGAREPSRAGEDAASEGGRAPADEPTAGGQTASPAIQDPSAPADELPEPPQDVLAAPKGDNAIVIVTYANAEHLKPVQQHYAGHGVETEILKRGRYFFLVTKNRYENPGRPGSNGAKALEEVKRIGLQYEAPTGYETFGSRPFQDAYGWKITD